MTEQNALEIPWEPVRPLSPESRSIDVTELTSISAAWDGIKMSMDDESRHVADAFYDRLRREWAIETGILEGLYTLDRGTTKTLIDKGFERDLIEHNDSDLEPGRLILILGDHQEASDVVEFSIREHRPMSKLMITELHNIITRNQEAVLATNSLNQQTMATPIRGQWKTSPNYIPSAGGATVQTCPPEQVDSQIDELLGYLLLEEEEGTNVGIVAPWFHHQFAKIHPFQDGNGRVVRALTNYLFVKGGLFPAVVTRDDRETYLQCLGSADQGDLGRLTYFFAHKQITAIKRVLSIHRGIAAPQGAGMVRDLAKGIVMRAQDQREQERQQLRSVDIALGHLSEIAQEHLQQELQIFVDELREGTFSPFLPRVTRGGSYDFTGHYYRRQVIATAEQAGEWVNFNEQAWWVRALIFENISNLRFLLSFHHVGRDLTGVAEVTALGEWFYRDPTDSSTNDDSNQPADPGVKQIECMSQGAFTVTWTDDADKVAERFRAWLTTCLVVALREWADTL